MRGTANLFLIALLCLCCLSGCGINGMVPCPMKLWAIATDKDSGELVVLTLYSSTSYFNYRGQEMGFQYELSEQFAKSLGVKLRVVVARNVQGLIKSYWQVKEISLPIMSPSRRN